MISVFAPGKIIVAGEWAVLEGYHSIAVALNKGVTVFITPSNVLQEFDSPFVKSAVDVAIKHINELGKKHRNFNISISSDISEILLPNGKTTKVGLGSSAAVVVAVIKAILLFHDVEESKDVIFELGCMAHMAAQGGLGSCVDVAVSTYGGSILYKKPHAVPIYIPKELNILIGFSGQSSSTPLLMKKVFLFKKENPKRYKDICEEIGSIVLNLVPALEKMEISKIYDLIKRHRVLLRKLGEESGTDLETYDLKKLCDIAEGCGACAKFSGAGGGDCAIAITEDASVKNVLEAWTAHQYWSLVWRSPLV